MSIDLTTTGVLPATVSAEELFEASPDGLLVVAGDGTVLAVNSALERLLGHAARDLVGRSVDVLVPPAVRERHHAHRAAFARAPLTRGMASGLDLFAVDADGQLVAVDVMLGPLPSAGPGCVLVAVRDAREQRRREGDWVHRALHDPLTGLANRSLVLDRLGQALSRADRSGHRVAVLFLDLDGFKAVNDRWGHAIGDEVLAAAAARLESVVRAGDTVGRLGGDEFLVLVEDPAQEEPAGLAERLRAVVEAPLVIRGRDASVGCSVGFVLSEPGGDVSAMVAAADERMYADKAARRAGRTPGTP